jgi:hypothetical protein
MDEIRDEMEKLEIRYAAGEITEEELKTFRDELVQKIP